VTVETRAAQASDVPELVRVINRAYRVEEFFVRGERTDAAQIRERLMRAGASFLVVDDLETPRRIAACVYVERRDDRGYFGMLAVDPDRQRLGLGRLLAQAAEDHCRTQGCRFLDISVVNLRRELPAFYARLGFAPFATAPFHDPDKLTRPAHLVLMTKPLIEPWES
jgi:GNAT superfamily N-acetyltransferase